MKLKTAINWMHDRKATKLKLIVVTGPNRPDFKQAIKIGSDATIQHHFDNNLSAQDRTEMQIMSYDGAVAFEASHADKGTDSDSWQPPSNKEPETTADTATDLEKEIQDHMEKADQKETAPAKRTIKQGEDTHRVTAGAQAIADMMEAMVSKALDVDSLRGLAEAKIQEAVNGLVAPTTIEVKPSVDAEPIPIGAAHKNFPLLLQMANARTRNGNRLNIGLIGPAGTGKSHACEQVATAMALPFYPQSAIDSKYELFGFRTATGEVVRTPFREAWEKGGVFLFDELSASVPSAIVAFNGSLANGIAPFPDGAIKRHPDCLILIGDNVINGPTASFSARNKMDSASIDRFVFIDWLIDELLEKTITGNDPWHATVLALRQAVKDKGIKDFHITPRSSLYGEALIRAGVPKKQVAEATIRKHLSDTVWNDLCKSVGL